MDVFQLLTCSLMGLLALSVLCYGLYLKRQRDLAEKVHLASLRAGSTRQSKTTTRIDPKIGARILHDSLTSSSNGSAAKIAVALRNDTSDGQLESTGDMDVDEEPETLTVAEPITTGNIVQSDTSDAESNGSELDDTTKDEPESVEGNVEESQEEQKQPPNAPDGTNEKPIRGEVKPLQLERTPAQKTKRSSLLRHGPKRAQRREMVDPASNDPIPPSEQALMMFVVCEDGASCRNTDINVFLKSHGLALGDDGLFVKTDEESGTVMFKVADAFWPFYFTGMDIEEHSTSGIALVMKLENLPSPQRTFDAMLDIAQQFAREFEGQIEDDNQNRVSEQTIAFYRSRVADFVRRNMTQSDSVKTMKRREVALINAAG